MTTPRRDARIVIIVSIPFKRERVFRRKILNRLRVSQIKQVSIPFKRERADKVHSFFHEKKTTNQEFQFPSNGNAQTKVGGIGRRAGLRNQVSIPFKRERASQESRQSVRGPRCAGGQFPSNGNAHRKRGNASI